MTHPRPPICLSRERLPGGFGTHMEGPSQSKAAGWAPGEEECGAETSILSRALSCREQAASQGGRAAWEPAGALRLGERLSLPPSLVLLQAGLGFGLSADARTHPGLGWPLAFADGQ